MLVAEWATAVELAMLAPVTAMLVVELDTPGVDMPWLAVAPVAVASTVVVAGLAVVDTAVVAAGLAAVDTAVVVVDTGKA